MRALLRPCGEMESWIVMLRKLFLFPSWIPRFKVAGVNATGVSSLIASDISRIMEYYEASRDLS
jgi:hypothetical protein